MVEPVATAIAVTRTTLIRLDRRDLDPFGDRYPS
jgi:hypothetical protein